MYTEALKFAHHEEKMIQTAIRTVTLNIYNGAVCDDMVYQFITTPPVSDYFSDLVLYLRKRCFHLDKIVHDKKEAWNLERSKLVLESDEITNDLYYFQDMLSVGEPRLSKIVTQNIFSLLVFPTLLPSLYLRDTNDMNKCISATTSLYLLSQIIQIIKGTNIIHFICALFLYIPIVSSMKESMESVAADTTNQTHVFERYVSELDQTVQLQCDGTNDIRRNLMLKQLLECMPSNSGFISFSPGNMLQKRLAVIISY
nr:protein TRANSPARENT TESTA 9-like isoform X1 [Ipomoea batatas]